MCTNDPKFHSNLLMYVVRKASIENEPHTSNKMYIQVVTGNALKMLQIVSYAMSDLSWKLNGHLFTCFIFVNIYKGQGFCLKT